MGKTLMGLLLVIVIVTVMACASAPPGNDSLTAAARSRQPDVTVDARYHALLEYQGRYEYENGSTLEMAASPKDLTLFAVLGNAKYQLTPANPAAPLSDTGPIVHFPNDLFLNSTKQRIAFQREAGKVVGYKQLDSADQRLYRRLPGEVFYPLQTWYPRLPGLDLSYMAPEAKADGLSVGSIEHSALNAAKLAAMIRHLAEGQYPGVHSVLILQDDKLVLEEYFYEYDANTLHIMRSATKSIVALLAGIAIDRGLLPGVEAPVWPYFAAEYPQIQNPDARKQRIIIKHLLTQSAGLDCNDWDRASAGNESRVAQADDWIKAFWDLPVQHEPGTQTSYCSIGVIALGRLVEKVAGIPLEQFAEKMLFAPLGIKQFDWRFAPDRSSTETFTQLSLTPRDMAKIGLLMLHNGKWQGKQVVSADWVRVTTGKQVQLGDSDYGYLWWRPYLNVPGGRHEAIVATGNGGQKIMLWPELNLITVFTGGNYNSNSPVNSLLINYILPPKQAPLPGHAAR